MSACSRIAARALAVAQLGHAHWLCGNLYEAIVRVPELIAARESTSPLGSGSPLRYYLPAIPVTTPALLAATVAGWRTSRGRGWLVTATACSVAGTALTAYLVRAVNLRLFFGAETLTEAERAALLRSWYRANALRVAATSGALVAAQRARRVTSPARC